MKKIAKALAVSGIVAGLGVAALPMSSYAVLSPTAGVVNDTTKVTAYVVDSIALNADAAVVIGDGTSTLVPGTAGTGTFNVEVATNNLGGFTLSATGGDLVNANGDAISPNAAAAAGTQGWSIAGTDGKAGTTAKALSATSQVLWTHAVSTSVIDETETFTVTVGTTDTTPTGTYEGNIVFTAAAVK